MRIIKPLLIGIDLEVAMHHESGEFNTLYTTSSPYL